MDKRQRAWGPLRTRVAAATSAATLAFAAGIVAGSQQPSYPPRVNPDAALALEFTKRVQGYMTLHKAAESKVNRLSKEANPEEIDKHQRALAQVIEGMRPKAQAGQIFEKEIRAYFRRQLERVFAGPEGRRLKDSIMDENPGPIKLRVNGRYPDTVPLSTMPPQVLASLPKLPQELEYRFIGDRLILLDAHAHLIVDYIEDALPR